jgi:hypothetical protein
VIHFGHRIEERGSRLVYGEKKGLPAAFLDRLIRLATARRMRILTR